MKKFLSLLNLMPIKFLLIFLITLELIVLIPRLSFLVSAQCQTNDRNDGLISAPNGVTGIFGNLNSTCVTGNDAAFAPFKIPTYDKLRTLYFDDVRATALIHKQVITAANPTEANLSIPTNSVIYVQYNSSIPGSGNLTLNGNPASADLNNDTAVVFVDGNLTINSDITYGSPDGTAISKNSGLVFVVRGQINIDSSVNRIDAVLMAAGQRNDLTDYGYSICTYIYGGTCPATMPPPVLPVTSQLLVNGSLIALDSNNVIMFRRNLVDNSIPSEKVVAQPKYLVILKDLFSLPLNITIEDTCYACGFP